MSPEYIFSVRTLYHRLQLAPASCGSSLREASTLRDWVFEITERTTESTFSTGTMTVSDSVEMSST